MVDVLLFKPDEYERLYNCTSYDVDKIPLSERRHPWIGLSFMFMFFVFEILYLPSLWIMRKRQFLQQSCYKMMFFMGIMDLFCMFINGFFTGYFAFKGYVFCSSPTFIYILGIGGLSLWAVQSDTGMMLALNRCLEMYNPEVNQFFFKGWRTYVWICISICHALYFGIFTKPVAFTSIYVGWFFNPHVGYIDDYGVSYNNPLHSIHNITVVVVLASCYLAFLFLLCKKSHAFDSNSRSSTAQKDSYVQVFVICFVNGSAASIYVYIQFFPAPEFLILFAQYGWFFAHACPAVIYLSINKSIQKRLKKIFNFNKFTTSVSVVQTKPTSGSDLNTSSQVF